MRGIVLLLALAAPIAGCGELKGDYDLPAGDANYDALQSAVTACRHDGGEIALKSGYDPRELSSYRCHIGAKASGGE
ncbi:MAG TPA: hypothetical protein VGS12_12755 [Caulobacteraceae bacterium]|nr:hypothetical protein [Caulobacteraceae bacterium]